MDDPCPETPAPLPPPARERKSAFGFFGSILLLYALGGSAQRVSPALGLAWSEVFAFLLPSFAAAAGSNLRPAAFLGLARRPTGPQLALALACGAVGFFAAGSLATLTAAALPASWVELFDLTRLFRGDPLERAAMAVLAAVLAPLAEEVAFRGYVQGALLTTHRPGAAIAWSALLFAAMHVDPIRFPAVLLLGILFGWLSWRAGTIWPAVAAHATNNAIGSALVLLGAQEGRTRVEDPRPALAVLAVAAAILALLASAYRAASPAPPTPEASRLRRDPADPSIRFRWHHIPAPYLAAGALGLALLLGIGAFAVRPTP